jgi:NAD(P)-dependent dehydrogenase (short-subunit alcohol dehydrogenase family)
MRLSDKTAVITGGATGIGAAIAERYAAEGARVVIADLNADAGVTLAERIGGVFVACDVADPASCDALFAATAIIDILVANAALTDTERHVLAADDEWWRRIIAVNLDGVFHCALRAARLMAPRRRGVMILLSSGGASRAHRGNGAYDAAKGGVEALVRALALDLGPYGIRVCGLVPGSIDSKGMSQQLRAARGETIPLRRVGDPPDIAGPAVFLASDDAAYVTGSMVIADGGLLAQQRSPQVDIFGLDRFPAIPERT